MTEQNQNLNQTENILPEPSLDRTQSTPLDSNQYETQQKMKKKLNVMAKAFSNQGKQQQQQQQQQQSSPQQQQQQPPQQQQQLQQQQQFIPQQQQPPQQMFLYNQPPPMMMQQMPFNPQNQMMPHPSHPFIPNQQPMAQQYKPQFVQQQPNNQFQDQQQNQQKQQKKLKLTNSFQPQQLFTQNEWDLKDISKTAKQQNTQQSQEQSENVENTQQQNTEKQEEPDVVAEKKEEKKLSPIEELQNESNEKAKEQVKVQDVQEETEETEETPVKYIIKYEVLFKMINDKKKQKFELSIFSEEVQNVYNRELDISKSTYKSQPGGYQKKPGYNNYNNPTQYNKNYNNKPSPGKQKSENLQLQQQSSSGGIQRQIQDPEIEKLKEQSNKWVKEKAQQGNQDVKQIKLNMNKLAPENQERIFPILANIAKISKECTETLVKQIIEKSWNEPKYQKTYSELCQYLSDKEELQFDLVVKSKSNQKLNYFKNFLLQGIQSAFETGKEILENSKLDNSQKKKKILGNVNFIGELFKAKVINIKIIAICTQEMLKKFICEYKNFQIDNDANFKTYENNLEGILVLYEKVGPEVEKQKATLKKLNNPEQEKQFFEQLKSYFADIGEKKPIENIDLINCVLTIESLFNILEYFKTCSNISQRILCLIENLIQRRQSQWQETFFQSEGPKKINEIHKEFNDELEEIDKRAAEFYQQQNELQSQRDYYYQDNRNYNVQYYAKEEQKVQTKVYVKKEPNQQGSQSKEQNYSQAQLKDAPKAKLDFSVNRTAQTKKTNPAPIVHKLPYHVIEERLKDMFKHLDKNQKQYEDNNGETVTETYTQEDYHKEAKNLYKEAQGIGFFQCFLLIFADGSLQNIKKRIQVISQLLQENVIDKDLFLKELQVSLKKMGDFFDDMPILGQGLAQIYFEFANQGLVKYQDVPKPEDYLDKAHDNYEDNVVIQKDFLQNFISSSLKVLKENTQVAKYLQDIEQLVTKMEFEEGESWFASLKTKFT